MRFSINRRIIQHGRPKLVSLSHIFPRISFTLTDWNNSSSTIFRELQKELPVCPFIFPTAFATPVQRPTGRGVVRNETTRERESRVTRNHLRAAIFVWPRRCSGPETHRFRRPRSSIRLIFYLGEEARFWSRRMHSAHAARSTRDVARIRAARIRRNVAALINTLVPGAAARHGVDRNIGIGKYGILLAIPQLHIRSSHFKI